MYSKDKRMAIAAVVSLLGFALTHTWYKMTDPRRSKYNTAAVAFIKKPNDEIHRRPADSFLWQLVAENESLHNGDSVRTSANGDVRIQFAQSTKYLDLEPDSSVVIQQANGVISLDLLEGSLFVAGDQGKGADGGPAITLKSGETKIDVTNAKGKLSGSSKAGVDFKILEGSAKTIRNGKVERLQAGSTVTVGATGVKQKTETLKIISPAADSTIYRNPEMPQPISFKWEGASADMQMQVLIGNTRKNLQPNPGFPGKSNSEKFLNLTAGKYFWKLQGIDPRTRAVISETSVNIFQILESSPPVAVFPKADSKVIAPKPEDGMELRWSTEKFARIKVEVYTPEPNAKIAFVDSYPGSVSSTIVKGLPFGEYEWKLIGLTEKNEAIAGVKIPFKFARKDPTRVNMAWSPDVQATQRFINNEPKIFLKWSADKKEAVRKFKIRLQPEGQPAQNAQVYESTTPELKQPLKAQGRYIASIEAVNADEEVIGTMTPRTVEVTPLPPLKGLTLLPADGSAILAKSDGSVNLQWRPLTGAKEYKFVMRNASGSVVKEETLGDETYSMRSLLPGQYTVQITPYDEFGRSGEVSRPRNLIVPEKSEVKAPKLKTIKVK